MLGFLLAAMVSAVLFGLTGFYPLQSEDWIHLEIISTSSSWMDAFDLPVSHSRPLWFLSLWSMLPAGIENPALMRIPLFAMHGLIGGLVGVLAQSLGASRHRAFFAVALFLCFPAVKGLAWILAISTPEHVLLMLIALIATAKHAKHARAATGITLVLAQVLAVGCHSAAALLPFCVAMLAIATSPKGWRVLLDRWFLAEMVVGFGLVLLLASLPTSDRYHSVRSISAIFANGSRALLLLLPETLRWPAIEGLRGAFGAAGVAFGVAVCTAVAAAFAAALWRANNVVRALLLAAVIDLVPPVLTAGVVVRYGYFPAAMLAVALLLSAKPTRRWIVPIVLLGIGWTYDLAVDVAEVRYGGRLGDAVIASARDIRKAAGPKVQVALLNAPGEVGAENDVPVFNWGLARALGGNGVDGPWRLLRTDRYITNSDIELVDESRLDQLAAEGIDVWRWDRDAERFVRR